MADESNFFLANSGAVLLALESPPTPLSKGGERRREYRVRYVKVGKIRGKGNRLVNVELPAEPLKAALARGMFDNRASFLDHAGFWEYPSLRDLVGVTLNSEWNEAEQSVDGTIRLYQSEAANVLGDILDGMLGDAAGGGPVPDVGLSLVFWPKWERKVNDEDPLRLAEVRHIESIDFVFEPAAEGRIKAALAAKNISFGGMEMAEDERQEGQAQGQPVQGSEELEEALSWVAPIQEVSRAATQAARAAEERSQQWLPALAKAGATAMIAASGLPAASREHLSARVYSNPGEVEAAIAAERAYLAKLSEDNVIQIGGRAPRGGNVQMGLNSLDQLRLAAEALVAGSRPEKGVAPLTGIRELYVRLSGDYEMTGVFHGDRVQLAAVDSSTMAALVADALNKRVGVMFAQYPHWWEPIVLEEDFTTLQSAKWITLGGVGVLPTVDEGAAYQELTWDDKTEESAFIKKGGYLGLTIEAIDKDDTRKIQAAPRALAQAAWLTLGSVVSAIFTANSGTGPTLSSDSTVLFHSNHANLGNTALSANEWAAVRLAMRKQAELNSSVALGALTSPRYMLVPPDLETTALGVLATESTVTYAAGVPTSIIENVYAEGDSHDARMAAAKRRVIVVDLWTDTDNWAAVADPLLYPSIGIGYRYGRVPEIFSVASPTAGLMFTNDTMPVKVRYFFSVGVIDYRGLYKENV